jgi:hypothetical protein
LQEVRARIQPIGISIAIVAAFAEDRSARTAVSFLVLINVEEFGGGERGKVEILNWRSVLRRRRFGGRTKVQPNHSKTLRAAHLVALRAAVKHQNVSTAATTTARHCSDSVGGMSF